SAGRFGRSRRHLRGSVGYRRGFRGSVRWRRGLRLPQLFRSRCEGGVLFGHELGESKRGALLVAFVGPVHRLSSRLSGCLVRGCGMPRTFDYRGGFRFGVGGRVRGGRPLGHLERLARNIFEQLFGFQLDWLRFDPLFSGERSLRHVGLGEYVFQPNCRSIRRGFGTDGRRGLTFGGAGGRRAERSGAGAASEVRNAEISSLRGSSSRTLPYQRIAPTLSPAFREMSPKFLRAMMFSGSRLSACLKTAADSSVCPASCSAWPYTI